jgi:DNA-binding transcriptional LysR family regulator
MMEFELLRSFVAVAECGGFHRAAAFRFVRRSAHLRFAVTTITIAEVLTGPPAGRW